MEFWNTNVELLQIIVRIRLNLLRIETVCLVEKNKEKLVKVFVICYFVSNTGKSRLARARHSKQATELSVWSRSELVKILEPNQTSDIQQEHETASLSMLFCYLYFYIFTCQHVFRNQCNNWSECVSNAAISVVPVYILARVSDL